MSRPDAIHSFVIVTENLLYASVGCEQPAHCRRCNVPHALKALRSCNECLALRIVGAPQPGLHHEARGRLSVDLTAKAGLLIDQAHLEANRSRHYCSGRPGWSTADDGDIVNFCGCHVESAIAGETAVRT
jgi:hypothetical protein